MNTLDPVSWSELPVNAWQLVTVCSLRRSRQRAAGHTRVNKTEVTLAPRDKRTPAHTSHVEEIRVGQSGPWDCLEPGKAL